MAGIWSTIPENSGNCGMCICDVRGIISTNTPSGERIYSGVTGTCDYFSGAGNEMCAPGKCDFRDSSIMLDGGHQKYAHLLKAVFCPDKWFRCDDEKYVELLGQSCCDAMRCRNMIVGASKYVLNLKQGGVSRNRQMNISSSLT